MAKINNRDIYPNEDFPTLLDFLTGTKEINGKTKSFPLQSVIQLINSVNGKNNIQYQFSDGTDPDFDYLSPGALFTNNNNTAVGSFTELIFNKETIFPTDLSLLFNRLGDLNDVVLKLENPQDPNNFFNFKVVSFEDLGDCFSFGVHDFNGLFLGEFINETIYSLYFDIKAASNEEDKFTSVGTISLVGNAVTISTGFGWIINAGNYANTAAYSNTVPFSSVGKQRFVLFAANVFNTFQMISGPESVSNPIAPPIPNDTLQVTLLLVTDGVISPPVIPIDGNSFVKKMESQDFVFNSGATTVLNKIDLIDDRSSISLVGSATDVKSVQLSGEFIRPGKPHFFKNRTGHNVKLWHLAGTGNIKYFFPNGLDLIVKPNEIIEFNTNANDSGSVRYEFVDLDISTKVDKVTGYSLTKNDLTDLLKTAYDNVVTWITTNGTNLLNHLNKTDNPHSVTKSQVGLSNVDNTSDTNKPISNATQLVLNTKIGKDDYGFYVPTIDINTFKFVVSSNKSNLVFNNISDGVTILGVSFTTGFEPYDGKYFTITNKTTSVLELSSNEGFFIGPEKYINSNVTICYVYDYNSGSPMFRQVSVLEPIDKQIEVSTNMSTNPIFNGKTILFTSNCTVTVTSTLADSYGFVFRTLAGVTVTWAITAPFTWETTPSTTPEKTTGSFMRRGNTNTILLDF